MYTQYTANYERVLKILEEHKDETVLNFFKTTHLHPLCKNLDFRAFLIMPIQREYLAIFMLRALLIV